MSKFQTVAFSRTTLEANLHEFDTLLSLPELKEREHVLPFFRKAKHLSAYMGSIVGIPACDQVTFELSLHGKFYADLAAGDSTNGSYLLVEFEDATPSSIFQPARKTKLSPDWSNRFLRGLAQLSDWFQEVKHMPENNKLQTFGCRSPRLKPMLVIGRDRDLDESKRLRLRELSEHFISKEVRILTFDEVRNELRRTLNFQTAASP